jgi:hypothetical protein
MHPFVLPMACQKGFNKIILSGAIRVARLQEDNLGATSTGRAASCAFAAIAAVAVSPIGKFRS